MGGRGGREEEEEDLVLKGKILKDKNGVVVVVFMENGMMRWKNKIRGENLKKERREWRK